MLEGRLVLGMALIAQGRHDEALQEMRVALETDPLSALGWLMKGEALVGKRDFAQAELALETAQNLDPSNPKVVELLGTIHIARAAGFEEVPIEATGTKEYPARVRENVRWAAAPSISFGPNEDTQSTVEGHIPAADAHLSTVDGHLHPADPAPTQETEVPPGPPTGPFSLPTNDEPTSVDDGEGSGRWSAAPIDAPVFASTPPRKEILPVTVLAAAKVRSEAVVVSVKSPAQSPPVVVPPRTAGPDEHTMFGQVGDIAVASTELAPSLRSQQRETREVELDEPAIRRVAPTVEATPSAPRRFEGGPGRLPSGAQTKIAPVEVARPQTTRRANQLTVDEEDGWKESAPTAPAKPRDPEMQPRRTSTVQVEHLRSSEELLVSRNESPLPSDTEDPLPSRGFDFQGSDSISLSEHEVVFVPPPSGGQAAIDSAPHPAASQADVISIHEEDELESTIDSSRHRRQREPGRRDVLPVEPSVDYASDRQRPIRESPPRQEAPRPEPARYDPPVHFVAPVPLGGPVSMYNAPAPELRPPSPSPSPSPSPNRSRRPHLAPALDAPRPPDSREPRGSSPSARGSRTRAPRPVGLLSRALEALAPSTGTRNWAAFAAVVAGAFATAVVAGLLIREWRLRTRVASLHEIAQKKLTAGNYPGYQGAELDYRKILAERDDRRAAALRAKVLAQLSFEFGEPPDLAQRAVQALGTGTNPDEREARVYVALAKGELELAARQAVALVKDRPGPQARYLLGQAQLLLDQPDEAAAALRTAAAEDPQNPIVLHALGLAEAALRHNDAAFDAYGRALTANANHIATIIDRALLQLRQGPDRDAAAGSLEGVVGKLVNDASPAQLARAYVGLAEIELGKGNVTAARSALSSAAARRRDHPLLLEELAKAYADAFELDPAEREARRALAVSGRLTPRLILAEVALRRSRPVQALTILEESASSRPEALVLRALAKIELGRNQEARADAELATRLDPSLVAAAVALARVDIGEGKYDAALKRLEGLETQGKHAEVAWALGQVYLARKQPDRARTCFREALHRQPLLLQARLALARLLHDAGQLGEAREEVNRILATNGAYAPARRELAALALDLGDAEAARDEFDALAERDSDLDTLLGGARARLMLHDAKGATERIDKALGLHPSGADLEAVNCLKARALLADHRANEAIQLLLKVVPTAARGEPLALLLESYLDYGRADWAERAIELAPIATRTGIELALAKARLSLEQARAAAGKGLAEEALARLRAGRSPVWLRAQAFALVGRAEFELGNARGAWKSLKSALELDPKNVRALFQLGLAALELKKDDDAIVAFEGAIASDPRFADAQFYLGRARKERSDPRADESLRAYLELEPRGSLAEEARRLLRGEAVTPGMRRKPTR